MPVADDQSDAVILQMLLPNLEADGFRVFLHPDRSILPAFMHNYRPAAIAMRADKKIAIEVTSHPRQAEPRGGERQDMFAAHPDWERRVIYAPTQSVDRAIGVIPRERVIENLDRLLTVFDNAGSIPALLTGWSVFEAAARSLIPDDLGRPQTPGRLLERLASDGYITPGEADSLRKLGDLRNAAAHGKLDAAVTRGQIAGLVTVTRTLLDLSSAEN